MSDSETIRTEYTIGRDRAREEEQDLTKQANRLANARLALFGLVLVGRFPLDFRSAASRGRMVVGASPRFSVS